MTVALVAPKRLPTWLETIIGLLPQTRPHVRAPDPPVEFRPLMEMARGALGARDLADLHDRLDGCVMRMRELPPLTLPSNPQPNSTVFDDLPEEPPDNAVTSAWGLNVSKKLLRALHEFAPAFRAILQLREEYGSPRSMLAIRALSVRPWSLHEGQVVPHALIESAIVQARGLLGIGALVAASVDTRRPEPWLTNALADAFVASLQETARLFASAGFDVELKEPWGLLDLEALFREADEADAAFLATFEEDVRTGNVGVPEEE